MSSLVSEAMKQLLSDAAEQFDWVIVDTPPVALMPDANLLAGMIDAALLVISANTTPYPFVQRASAAIGAGADSRRHPEPRRPIRDCARIRLLRVLRPRAASGAGAAKAIRAVLEGAAVTTTMVTSTWRTVVLLAGETILLTAAVVLGSYLRLRDSTPMLLSGTDGVLRVLLIVVVCQICLHYADLYDLRTIVDTRDLIVRLLQALGATSLILAVIYFWFPDWVIGRGVFLIVAALVISLIVAWRLAFAWLSKNVAPRERLLLVGTNPASIDLARELFERRHELGVEIVGFIDPDPARVGAAVLNPGVVGTIEDIPSLVERLHVDRVVVSLTDARGRLPMDRLLDIRLKNGVSFDHLASVYEEYTGQDRGRESPSELVDFLRRLPQDARVDGGEARVRRVAVARRAHRQPAGHGARRGSP